MPKSKEVDLAVLQPNAKCVLEPLRYYDPELQDAGNAELDPSDPERFQRAIAKSKHLRKEYRTQLKQLHSRLNQRTYARLLDEREPLFDSNLLEFAFGDHLGFKDKPPTTRWHTSVRATFLSFEKDRLHELRYRHIESARINVPAERWYEWGNGVKEIGNLLAHELTAFDKSLMEHKFLFTSGATITIVFAEMAWSARRATQRLK